MSNAIVDLIVREQSKCERRRATIAATKAEIEIIGDSVKLQNKLLRQEAAVEESLQALEKLNAASGKKPAKK